MNAGGRRALLGILMVVALVAAGIAVGGAAVGNPTFACGNQTGPAWSVPGGARGTAWYVMAISTRDECANAHDWTQTLGARIAGHGGLDTQVIRTGGFGCVMIRSQLFAVCLRGDGGHGAPGVAVIGNPAQNPWVTTLSGSYTPTAAQQVADVAGVPGPKGTAGCNSFNGASWKFRAQDGHMVSGTGWRVRGDTRSDGGCSAGVADLREASARAAGDRAMDSRSFLSDGRLQGDWACVAAHDYAWPGGASSIVGIPVAGCARVVYPFGTGTLTADLEQFVIWPDVAPLPGSASGPVVGGRNTSVESLQTEYAINHFGIQLVAVAAATARVTGATNPAHTDQGILRCGAHRVGGGTWHRGSAHSDSWLVAVKGGYPCELAEAVFAPFLAYLTLTPNSSLPPGSALRRDGWLCDRDVGTLSAHCTFDPATTNDPGTIEAALGRSAPPIRVAVAANSTGADGALMRAVGG